MVAGVAVCGVGTTEFSRRSGRSVLALAVDACLDALDDAHFDRSEIDGLACFHEDDSVSPEEVATGLGLSHLDWTIDWRGGGSACCALIGTAADAIASGRCKVALVYRVMNGSSGVRMGSFTGTAGDAAEYLRPFGAGVATHFYGMACRRHMHLYGTTREQLGAVAVLERRGANRNPRAMMRDKPLTMEMYLDGPPITEPFHLFDCCLETDGAVAVLLAGEDRAQDARAVRVAGWAFCGNRFASLPYDKYEHLERVIPARLGDDAFRRAQVSRDEIDLLFLYDSFTYTVVSQLEELGFCPRGEGGPFVADMLRTVDGPSRLNPHGGLLSEGYVHSMNSVAAAVRELRGEGTLGVDAGDVALVTGVSLGRGGALVLQRQQ